MAKSRMPRWPFVLATAVLAVPGLWFGFWALYDYREGVVTRNAAYARAHLSEIEIGMTKAEVRRHLGSPSGKTDHCWVYGKGWVWTAVGAVDVCFRNGVVISMQVERDYGAD